MLRLSGAAAPALILLLASAAAFPDNIQQARELSQPSDNLNLEAEASAPQARTERCAACTGGHLEAGPLAFASNIAQRLQSIPPGAEVHSQSSFEGCSTEKGCAGIKVKDGRVIEKYGDVEAFKAASSADTGNEFSFHAGLAGNEVLEGGIPKDGPFWWMKENSPFRDAYGNYEKYSKSSSSSSSSGSGGAGAGGGTFSASLDLSGNPFLNGDISKLASGFIGGGQTGSSSASFGGSQGGVDISNNPFLNGKVQPSGSTFQSSSFESSYSSGGKQGGAIDLSKNPFLAGGLSAGANQGASGNKASSSSFSSQSSSQFGSSGSGAGNFGGSGSGSGFGVQGGFQSGQFGSQPGSAGSVSKFSSSSQSGSGYTGSSPSPFTASTGSNVNRIEGSQKTNEFDFSQQQQTQQNIDEIYSQNSGGNKHEHSNGELQQTCAGQGYICVHKAQCNNGVVNTNGAGILQARTKKTYCNTKNEICCRIEITNVPGSGVELQGVLGVGNFIFSGQSGQTTGSASGTGQAAGSSSSNSGSQFGSSNFGATASSSQFGQSGSGQTGANGANANGASSAGGANGFGVTSSFGSSSSTFESNRGGANGANAGGNFGASGSGINAGTNSGGFNRGSTNFASASNAGSTGNAGNTGNTGAAGTYGFKETSSSSSSFNNRFGTNAGGGLIHIPPSTGGGDISFKGNTNSQNNFIETTRNTESDSFSAGSQANGVFRPGSGPGQKPGIPYLPPVVDVSSGSSNTISSTVSYTPSPSTPRPYTPTTTGPTYLPPQGEQSINRPTFVPGPRPDTDTEGSLLLDQNRQPLPRPRQPFQPAITDIPSGCAAALKCTPIEFCTAEGVISNTSVRLSKDQEDFRVPLTDCKDIESGTIGKCCRDSTYTDPWPTNQLGKWVPGVFGGDDGAYKPDSRGSPNNPRPTRVRPTPAPTTGGILLNNYRTTDKPDYPYPGPNQVTPGYGQTATQQTGQSQVSFVSQQGQGSLGTRGQFGQGQTVSQGFGQTVSQGGGQIVTQGQGQYEQAGQGQFGQTGQGQFGQTVTQQTSQTVSKGQFGQTGQGQIVTQGQGQIGQAGQGAIINQGQGQFGQRGQGAIVTQGQSQFESQSKGQFGQTGQGAIIGQGQGQFGQRGQGASVSQGQGQFSQSGQGEIVSQGQGAIVSQGQGQFVSQGKGQFGQSGQGAIISQGQGQFSQSGQGQFSQSGQGQTVSQGGGAIVSQGGGAIVSQGGGSIVSQGGGAFGQAENAYGESVQRVTLSQYGAGGQCGFQKGSKPYGNRNDLEVDFAEIPWQAMILLETNRSLLCGGVITRPEVVITSAACVEGLQAKNVLIKGGEWKLGIDEEPLPFQIVQVKTILRHPGYKAGSLQNDVAILILSEKLRLANNIFPICLPNAGDTLDGFYNGAGECIVTGWGKQVLQVNIAGAIMHSINVSLINPGECQAKISQDYPHLLEQYDADSCACGQPTNPINNVCKVDIGSALACTTGDGHFVLRGVYSWDSGCQAGNQLAAFYKFDLEWYEWALGLSEGSGRFTSQYGGQAQIQRQFSQQSQFSQINSGGVKGGFGGFKGQLNAGSGTAGQFTGGQFNAGLLGGQLNAGIAGGQLNAGVKGGHGFTSRFSQSSSSFSENQSANKAGDAGFGKFGFSSQTQLPAVKYQYETKTPVKGSSFSASYSSQEKQFYQSKPQIVTYTTKPEIVTYTTKPEIFTYTTKPKIVTFTTKPQIITYETSGSGQNPQYVAPGVTFNPSFSELVGKTHAQAHGEQCKCLENGRK